MGIPSRSTNTIKGDLDARDEQMKSRTSAGYENTASQLTENVEAVLNMDEPFLHPIDEPNDPAVEQAYQNMKQYFGKVMMPARVFNSRMPIEFLQFYTHINVGSKTGTSKRNGDVDSAASSPHKCLPVLHRFKPRCNNLGFDEPSKI